ncbi:MAG: hypothetical protein RJB13_678 [Pseudomonadota bacterium]|jgi:hypothetical protein
MSKGFNALELERMMSDQAARCDSMGRVQKRNSILQQLLSRVQGLSDEDFETAFETFQSLIATLETKRRKSDESREKDDQKPRDLIREVNAKVNQSRGTTI